MSLRNLRALALGLLVVAAPVLARAQALPDQASILAAMEKMTAAEIEVLQRPTPLPTPGPEVHVMNSNWVNATFYIGASRYARVAREQLRQTDVLARLGGEEFGVVLPNVGTQALGLVAEKLRVAVGAVRVPTGRGRSAVQVTMSLGGVSLPAGRVDAATLVELADRALLRAKHAGRDRVVIDPSGEPG